MKQKHIKIISTVGTILCLCVAIGYAVKLHHDCKAQRTEWNSIAEETFREALRMEVDWRGKIPYYQSTDELTGTFPLNRELPDSITFVTSAYGSRRYALPKEKYRHNLYQTCDENSSITYLLQEYPIVLDTLHVHWDSLLCQREVDATTAIRYAYTDWGEYTDTLFSPASAATDSLLTCYLGVRCEAEFTGYVGYGSIYRHWGVTNWLILFLLLAASAGFSSACRVVYRFAERKFTRQEILHVADARIEDAKIYQLAEGITYDVMNRTISRGTLSCQLPPQSGILFVLFLRAEDHRLTFDEIDRSLWRGKGSRDQLFTAIKRLRSKLEASGLPLKIIKESDTYQLKITHSIDTFTKVSNG